MIQAEQMTQMAQNLSAMSSMIAVISQQLSGVSVKPAIDEKADEYLEERTRYLTPPQAADYLSVSVFTLNQWRSKGKGPTYVRVGHGLRAGVRYHKDELEQFLHRQK